MQVTDDVINFTGNKNIITNIYRIQAYNSIMSGYFCFGLIDFMPEGKNPLVYKNLFYPSKYKKNDKMILKYFQWWKSVVMFAINIEYLKPPKYHISFKNYQVFLLFTVNVVMNTKKLKKKNQMKYWKLLV